MTPRALWLITNSASGSSDSASLQTIEDGCAAHGFIIHGRTMFPQDAVPTPAMLDAADIGIVAICAGDGTLNAAISALAGWGGEVLVLPGGTMNVLYHRLFGDLPLADALALAGRGEAVLARLPIVASALGMGFAGVLAGPATALNQVREAMRAGSVLQAAVEAQAAVAEVVSGAGMVARDPVRGRAEGYPLLQLVATDNGLKLDGYLADSAADIMGQAVATFQGDFRDGPKDDLGHAPRFVLAASDEGGFGLLIDGEPAQAAGALSFWLEQAPVNLLSVPADV